MEAKLLSKVIEEKVLPEQVESKHLMKYPKVYAYIKDYYREYSTTPSKELVVSCFPDFSFVDANDPMLFYENQIMETYHYNLLRGAMADGLNFLDSENPNNAIQVLQEALSKVEDKGMKDISVDSMETLAMYEQSNVRTGGYFTGIEKLDQYLGGVFKKELHIIAGRAKVGKTMIMLKIAHEMYLKGANIIFISKEMSAEKLVQRFDAIHNNIPLGNIRKGKLSFTDLDNIKKSREEFSARKNKCIFLANEALDRSTTVWTIVGKIQKYKPDIVFVDSFYLFSDGSKRSEIWERVGNVANDLADIARRCDVCMFGSTQLNRQVSEKENNTSYKNMGYSDTIIQVSNSVTALFQNAELRDLGIMEASVIATRDGETGDFRLNWDFNEGCQMDAIDEEYDDEDTINVD